MRFGCRRDIFAPADHGVCCRAAAHEATISPTAPRRRRIMTWSPARRERLPEATLHLRRPCRRRWRPAGHDALERLGEMLPEMPASGLVGAAPNLHGPASMPEPHFEIEEAAGASRRLPMRCRNIRARRCDGSGTWPMVSGRSASPLAAWLRATVIRASVAGQPGSKARRRGAAYAARLGLSWVLISGGRRSLPPP